MNRPMHGNFGKMTYIVPVVTRIVVIVVITTTDADAARWFDSFGEVLTDIVEFFDVSRSRGQLCSS